MKPTLEVSVMGENVVSMKLHGDLTKESINNLDATLAEATQTVKNVAQLHGHAKILFDMTEFTGSYDGPTLARFAQLAKEDGPYTARTACFGGPATFKMLIELVAVLSGRENLRYFPAREQALAWLGE